MGDPVVPTCVTGPMPVGLGGTIADGTYVFASQTDYNEGAGCPSIALSGTMTITGSYILSTSGGALPSSGSAVFMVEGNSITISRTCPALDGDAGSFTPDAPSKTYTATATTLTIFSANSAAGNPNPDRVEVFTKVDR